MIKIWGGNKLLRYQDNARTMHGNIKVPYVGLVNHAYDVYGFGRVMISSGAPTKAYHTFFNGSLMSDDFVMGLGIGANLYNCFLIHLNVVQ